MFSVKPKIALSVGHHLEAKGARHRNVYEYDLALEWVGLIASSRNATEIVMVPPGRLGFKVAYINELGPSVAMELHFNSCGGCGAKGSETLYYPGSTKGKALATAVQSGIVNALEVKDRGAKEGWYKMDRPGVKDYAGDVEGDEVVDYFLRKTRMPSLILEPMFIDEAAGFKLYNQKADEIAKALAEAVDDVMG